MCCLLLALSSSWCVVCCSVAHVAVVCRSLLQLGCCMIVDCRSLLSVVAVCCVMLCVVCCCCVLCVVCRGVGGCALLLFV